jgi:hypothetical protein
MGGFFLRRCGDLLVAPGAKEAALFERPPRTATKDKTPAGNLLRVAHP